MTLVKKYALILIFALNSVQSFCSANCLQLNLWVFNMLKCIKYIHISHEININLPTKLSQTHGTSFVCAII